jgi:replicative superfamily II helicase
MDTEDNPLRQLTVIPHPKLGDPLLNSVVSLTLESLNQGHSVLIFCSSRMMTVDTAVWSQLLQTLTV